MLQESPDEGMQLAAQSARRVTPPMLPEIERSQHALEGDDAVALQHELLDQGPPRATVRLETDPLPSPERRRDEAGLLRISTDVRRIEPEGDRRHAPLQPFVGDEHALAGLEVRMTPGIRLARFGQGQAELPQTIEQGVVLVHECSLAARRFPFAEIACGDP